MIQLQTKNDIVLEGVEETTKMSIALDESNQAHIVKVLTENYKYPIASTVREAASNSWDSHVMSDKKDLPFHVRLLKTQFGYTLEVEDFGLGLDKEGFYKYYMKIGNSSKRGVKGVLGFYGCGAKSALSIEGLTNYEVVCRKNGIENKFLIFKGEDFPESTPLHEIKTEEKDGVLIRINLQNHQYSETVEAIKEQLCYFPTAYIKIDGNSFDFLNAKIFENELFSWSEIYPSQEMHINFGGVHYPIDWGILKINKLRIPIGIKISPDEGVNPFFNRESLEYNSYTKKVIKDQITKVSEWFINKYNETNKEFKSLEEIFNYYYHSDRNIDICGEQFEINELEKHSSVKMVIPTYKNIVNLPLDTVYREWKSFLENYKIVSEISYNRFSAKGVRGDVINKINGNIYLIGEEQPKKIVIDYLKEKHDVCYFVRKLTSRQLKSKKWNDDSYESILQLKKFPKSQWRILINEWNILENELIQKLQPLPIVPKEFIESRKKARVISDKYKRISGEINFKIATDLEKYSQDWKCKFVPKIINLKDFHKRKKLMVYSLEENRQKLDYLFQINSRCRSYSNLEIAIVGKKDYETLKEIKIHNLVSMEQFVKSKYKVIARYVTAYKINKLIDANKEVFKLKDFIIKNISANFGELLKDLNDYAYNYDCKENELMEELIQFCDENKYYDYPFYQTYTEIEKEIKKIDFIRFFTVKDRWGHQTEINPEAVAIIKELLISRKFRMDYTYYNKAVTPETELVNEEELVEN